MRILIHAIALKRLGGSSRHFEEFMRALSRVGRDHEYIVCLDQRFAATYKGILPPSKVVPVRIRSDLHRLWWDQVALNRLVEKEHCDVILSLLTFSSIRPNVPQINLQRSPIYFCDYYLSTLRGKERWIILLRRWLLKKVMQASRIIVTPTAAMRDAIRRFYPSLPLERFRVIPHGFDKERFEQIVSKTRTFREDVDRTPLRILFVSVIYPYKGFELLPLISRGLLDRGITHKIYFTGAPEDNSIIYNKILAKAQELRVKQWLRPVGILPLEQTYRLYGSADIFFFPSLCESFGFPMVEAMGAGLPIVAADTPVNREICDEAALYFEPNNVEEAVAKLLVFCANRKKRTVWGQKARRRYEETVLSMVEYTERIVALFEAAVKED